MKPVIEDRRASGNLPDDNVSTKQNIVETLVDKAVIRRAEIELMLREDGDSATSIVVPWSAAPVRRRREIIVPPGASTQEARPIRSESRARLVEGIAKARLWLDELIVGRVTDTNEIADREGCSDRSIRMTLSLAFLNPRIVQAAVEGTLPKGSGVATLLELPADWQEQIRLSA